MHRYIAEDNLRRADAWLDAVWQEFAKLIQMPFIGKARPELGIDGLRSIAFRRYTIFYQVFEEELLIFNVLHSARQLHQDLFEDET